jgi:hypothetical protein
VLCTKCKVPDPSVANTFQRLWKQETHLPPPDLGAGAFHKTAGCPACNGTGYLGRTGLFVLLVFTVALKRLVLVRVSGRLYKAAVTSGMRTMLLNGLEKAFQGLTTIEEVLRVTGESEESSNPFQNPTECGIRPAPAGAPGGPGNASAKKIGGPARHCGGECVRHKFWRTNSELRTA